MTSAIRILFVDDHTLFRESVVRLLEQEAEFEVVAHCATLRDANQIITTTAVDVVLLDYDLGAEVGTEFVDVIQRMRTGVKILMVTGGMGSNSTLRAVNGGISGIILKHNDPHHLVAAIRRVAAGETWWDPTILHSLGAGANRGSAAVETAKALTDRLKKLYTCYMETDASLAEINPLILEGSKNGGPQTIKALDAKFNFDSNAMYRHPEIAAYRDLDEEDPAEIEASKFDLAYIQLDGNIGCLVNGAGLAMATMDTIKLFGGSPANFLDVGGGASAEKVTEAFKIMLGNPKVKAILVNIFGGIMRCDTIAEGVIAACKATNLTVPLVVRMKGTNEELGKKLLAESGLPIISADSMAEAAKAVMAALK